MNNKIKSKITTFMTLGTRPEDYSVKLYRHAHTHISHCQLCGSALDYSYSLVHKDSTEDDTKNDLFIGSDCVDNFMDTYFPFKKEEIKRKIANIMADTKSHIFLKENPNIEELALEVRKYFNTDLPNQLRGTELYRSIYTIYRSYLYKEIMNNVKDIRRAKYLSKPKTLRLLKIHALIADGHFMKLAEEIQAVHSKKIKDVIEEESFYKDIYLKECPYHSLERIQERAAWTELEKQDFVKKNKIKVKIEVIPGVI